MWVVHADEHVREDARAAISTAMTGFIDAVWSGDDAAAVAHCSDSCRQGMEKGAGASARFGELRDFVTGLTDEKGKPVELHFLHRSARISGTGMYGERQMATFSFDLELVDREWKIKDFAFEKHSYVTLGELVKKAADAITGHQHAVREQRVKVSQRGIYHLPGGRFYASVTAAKWFATEAEAKAAGYRPSQRG